METIAIEKVLSTELFDKVVKSDDYVDKYYLKKAIQNNFPTLNDETIYFCIEFCNGLLEPPRRRKEYIRALARVLSEHA